MSRLDPISVEHIIDTLATVIDEATDRHGRVKSYPKTGNGGLDDIARHEIWSAAMVLAATLGIGRAPYLKIIKRCTRFLQSQRDTEGTYGHADDLDCISLATAALWYGNPDLANGRSLAQVTRLLIASEHSPGGPYRSHRLAKGVSADDVDIAVNANVAWMLQSQKVELSSLQSYLEQAMVSGSYGSRQYADREAIYYFISRTHVPKDLLKTALLQEMDEISNSGNVLRMGYALCASVRCGLEQAVLDTAASSLYAAIQRSFFKSQPVHAGCMHRRKHCGASPTGVNAAIAAEALHLYCATIRNQADSMDTEYATHLWRMQDAFLARQPRVLAMQLQDWLQTVTAKDHTGEIRLMACECAGLFPAAKRMTPHDLGALGFASLLGWSAYSIYDDVMDEQKHVELLPIAHACAREVQSIYARLAVPGSMRYIERIFGNMDNANAGEYLARIARNRESAWNRMVVSDRSMGHALGVLMQAFHAGYDEPSREFRTIESWFRHYIAAKQLHDDARDWEEDTARGAMTYPVRMLSAIPFARRAEHFLMRCMPTIARMILDELDRADAMLLRSTLYPQPLLKYSGLLRKGTYRALREPQEMHSFMQSMGLQNVPLQ